MNIRKKTAIFSTLTAFILTTIVAAPIVAAEVQQPKINPASITTMVEPPKTSLTFAKDKTYKPLTGEEYKAYLAEEARKAEEARLAAEEAARKAAEEEAARKAAEEKAAADAAAAEKEKDKDYTAPAAGTPEPGSAKEYAYTQVAARGWSESEYNCLVSLWNRESGWNHYANNASSGAYGIPQALPGSKMASAGADWATNYQTQINWGLGYISGRYGTPCGAWAHSEANNWY
jgi:hypothetical protein